MPGRWNPANPPTRPGAYTNFKAAAVARIGAPLAGTVAVPIVNDWGPEGEVVEANSFGEYKAVYGDTITAEGYRAGYQAFKGEGINNRGGAAKCLFYRMVGSSGKAAFVELADTAEAEDADAVVITAKYKGSRGNDLKITVEANANDESKYDIVVLLDGTEVERWSYTKATNSTLAEVVSTKSDWITVKVNSSAAALETGSFSLTEGDDGSELEAEDWETMMAALGSRRFSVFVPYDLTDETVIAAVKTWASHPENGLNAKGKRFTVVLGHENATLEAALEEATALGAEDICYLGGFKVQDSGIVDANGDAVTLTPSTFAPRVAGVIAATGGTASITFSRFADVTLVEGLSDDDDFVDASEGGVITVAEDSNELAPVRIEQDVTTYLSDTEAKPKEIFGKLKFVRTMQSFEMAITEFAENKEVIGKLGVNDESREYLIGQYRLILESYEETGEVLTGSRIYISQDPPPTTTDNFIHTVYELTFGRDLQQARGTVIVA